VLVELDLALRSWRAVRNAGQFDAGAAAGWADAFLLEKTVRPALGRLASYAPGVTVADIAT
jgi:hypothetical protein